MSTNVYWTVHSESDTFIVNAQVDAWANIVIGESTTVRVWINDDGDLTVGAGETHTVTSGTAEFYETVTVNGTLTVNGELVVGSEESRWGDLEAYTDYAGQAVTRRGVDNTPWFVEQLPSGARVSSIVLGFEPSQHLKDRGVEGLWGVLVGGEDRRNSPLTNHQLSLDVWVLDRFGEYADVSAVKTDLEA